MHARAKARNLKSSGRIFKFDPTNSKWRLQVEAAMVGNQETRAAKGRFLTSKITSRNGLNPTNVFGWKTEADPGEGLRGLQPPL